jgi:predicted phage-related endonuclease
MMTNQLNNFSNEQLADEIGNLDATIKFHDERLALLKNEFKLRGFSAARGRDFSVTVSESTSKRLDTKKLREALGDALDGYETETTLVRMTIKAAPRIAQVA